MADWRVCPYQRYFEEYSKNKLKGIKTPIEDLHKDNRKDEVKGNHGTDGIEGGVSYPKQLGLISNPGTIFSSTTDGPIANNIDQLNKSPPTTSYHKSYPLSNSSPSHYGHDYNTFVYMNGTSNNSCESIESPASSLASPYNLDDRKGYFDTDFGGVTEEPEDMQMIYDSKNRPKLKVLTKFLGGF